MGALQEDVMRLERVEGCWTAMVTPFNRKGEVDFEGLEKNVRFQIENGASLVPTGTTGESPTLDWREHDRVITKTVKLAKGKAFIMPYVIPGRTGTKWEVEDLAILHRKFKNVRSVKEATGDLERMAKIRTLCGEDFDILSGDDDKTFEMMVRKDIRATGIVSVMSNVVPGPIGG